MRYEWDEAKCKANLRKHGVDFADAIGALEDPRSITIEDPGAEGELRCATLGRGFAERVLVVVWTERAQDTIRIISARRASRGESRPYREERI